MEVHTEITTLLGPLVSYTRIQLGILHVADGASNLHAEYYAFQLEKRNIFSSKPEISSLGTSIIHRVS